MGNQKSSGIAKVWYVRAWRRVPNQPAIIVCSAHLYRSNIFECVSSTKRYRHGFRWAYDTLWKEYRLQLRKPHLANFWGPILWPQPNKSESLSNSASFEPKYIKLFQSTSNSPYSGLDRALSADNWAFDGPRYRYLPIEKNYLSCVH